VHGISTGFVLNCQPPPPTFNALLQLQPPTRVNDFKMPASYDINDYPKRTKSPKPKSENSSKHPAVVSPVKVRDTNLDKKRQDRDFQKYSILEPQSKTQENGSQTSSATQISVYVPSTPSNVSLLSSMGYERSTSQLDPNEIRWLRYIKFRNSLSSNGVKKKELEEICLKHFPEFQINPQVGLMDIFRLSLDPAAIEGALNSGEKIAENISSLQNITHTIELGQSSLKAVDKVVCSLDSFNSLLLLITVLVVMRPVTQKEKVLAGFIVFGFVVAKSDIAEIWKNSSLCAWLSNTPDENAVEPQSFNVDDFSSMVVGLMNSYIFVGAGKDLLCPAKMSKVINSISRTEVGVGSLIRTAHLLISYVHSSIDHFWYGNPWFVKTGHTFIDEFLRESSDLLLLHESKKLLDLQSSLDRVRAVIVLGETVSVKIPGSHETVGLRLQVNNALAEMKKIKKSLLASNFANAGLRCEPSSLMLRGPPGVGKSQAMQHIAHAINALTLSGPDLETYSENPGSAIFPRAAENKFWDGYKQSMNVVFFDDILQVRDIQGDGDNEAMNVIRSKNIFEYPLHCAEITSKGNTSFRSKFIIANTNMQNFKFESINEPGAFMRRWDIVVDVIPKEEYCVDPSLPLWKRRFDVTKLPLFTEEDAAGNPSFYHLIGDTRIEPEYCDFHVQKLHPGERQFESAGQILSFKELVFMYYKIHLLHERRHDMYMKSIDARLEEYRAMRDDQKPIEEVWMDEVQPQALTSVRDKVAAFEFVSRLNDNSRRYMQRLHLEDPATYNRIVLIFKHVYFCSVTLEGIFWTQDVFDAIFDLVLDVDFVMPQSGEELEQLASTIYLETVKPGEIPDGVQVKVKGFGDARSFIATHKDLWNNTPSWINWVYKIYKYTFSHVVHYCKEMVGPAYQHLHTAWLHAKSQFSYLLNSPLGFGLSAAGGVVAGVIIFEQIAKMMFAPKKKSARRRAEAQVAASTDPEIVLAREELAIAEAVFKSARDNYEKQVARVKVQAFEEEELEDEPQSDERHNRTHKVRRVIRKPVRPPPIQPQSLRATNFNLVSINQRIMHRNVLEFCSPQGKSKSNLHVVSGFALVVEDRFLVFPYHFLSVIDSGLEHGELEPDDKVHLRRLLGSYLLFTMTVGELLDSYRPYELGEKRDLVMVRLPSRFQPVPSCLKFVATDDQLANYVKFDALLSIPRSGGPELHSVVATAEGVQHVGSGEFQPYTVDPVFRYTAYCSVGDCGSLLFVNDKANTACLVGIHVAGAPSLQTGFSSQISCEFLLDYMKFLGGSSILRPEDVRLIPAEQTMPNMYCVGEFAPGIPYPRSIGRTKILPSHLHGKAYCVLRRPARLRPFFKGGERIDPNQLALSKYCEPDVYIDLLETVVAVDSFNSFLHSVSTVTVEPEVYDYRTAVLGDSSGFWTSIPRGTSSGYPWNCMTGPSSKTRFWGTDVDFDLDNPDAQELQRRVMKIIDLAKSGARSVHYFTDSLKDERRSLSKVQEGVTRMISCCPVDLLIAFRMYFGAFQKWLVANRINNGCAIGINEKSPEWDLLAKKLDKFGRISNKGAGDHQGFDTKHRGAIADAVLGVVFKFYGDCSQQDKTVRRTLWLEVTNSYHINEGLVYEWFTALPSGIFPTTFFNCVANHLIFRMAWRRMTKRGNREPHFDSHVYLCVLGDDNVFCVSPGFTEVFTESNLAVHFKKYGYVYTPEDKEVLVHASALRPLDQVSFLKRNFVYNKDFGRIVGSLDVSSITDMLNWQKESSNSYADCEVLIDTALEEFALHGRSAFNKYTEPLFRAIKQTQGINMPLNSTYDQMVTKLLDRECEPLTVDFDRFFSDYGADLDTCMSNVERERFEKQRGGLFSLTAKTPHWQPQSSLGAHTNSGRLIHRSVLNRIATMNTNSSGNSITDQAPPGQTDQGLFAMTRRAEEISQQTSDTTKSTVDADTPVAKIEKYVPMNPRLLDSARTGVSQDVRAFLAKPIAVASGTFTTADLYPTFIYTSDGIPQSLLYSQPLWLNKLSGNYAFRGTLHLSLQVNATRFQAGRYILGWVPSGGGTQYAKFRRQHTASLTCATQVPHVEIDINCDSEATLIIPHINVQGWATLDTIGPSYFGNNGSIFIAAYSGLGVATGSTDCAWTLFAHFEDVEVAMPIQPQSGRLGTTARVRRKVRVASEVEQESQGLGPLSSHFSTVSKAAASLSGIPYISSVAGPISWAMGVASGVAQAFGWSRPHNAQQANIMQRFIVPRFTNADVADNSTVLGAMDSNTVEELPGFAGSDIDEMSLSYLTSISAYFNAVNWTQAQAPGTLLLNVPLSPRQFFSSNIIAAQTFYTTPPISYFSTAFALYRGSIKLTVKLVKTEFHTGRILVSFKPREGAAGAATPTSLTGTAYEHREIIDIRMGNEFTLEFPFMSTAPYRTTSGTDASYGEVNFYVLNTLEAPPNVPSAVPLLFEVCGGKDFELAEPSDMNGQVTQIYVPQSGRNVCEIVSEDIGNSSSNEDNAFARLCIGERILSIRQLLKRFSANMPNTGPTPGFAHLWNVFQSDWNFLVAAGETQPVVVADFYTYMQACYALQRGGVRLKLVTTTAEDLKAYVTLLTYNNQTLLPLASQLWTTVISTYVTSIWGNNKPSAVFSTTVNGGVEVEVPFYSRYSAAPICDLIGTQTAAPEGFDYNPQGPVPRNRILSVFSSPPVSPILTMRAVSEDFSFGMFVSTPPLVRFTTQYTS
jgi:hypothetical protein